MAVDPTPDANVEQLPGLAVAALADTASGVPRGIPGFPCSVGLALGPLTEAQRQEARDLFADTYTNLQIQAAFLRVYDVVLSEQQLGRHRRAKCSCQARGLG